MLKTPEGTRYAYTENKPNYDPILRALTSSDDMHIFRKNLRAIKGSAPVLFTLMHDKESIKSVLKELVQDVNKNRYPISVLASQFTISDLPGFLNDALKPQKLEGNEFGLQIIHAQKSLCTTSEQRIMSSSKNNALITLNEGSMAVKYEGKLVGLPLKSFVTRRGTFIEEVWYTPESTELNLELEDIYENGEGQAAVNHGIWIPMRPVASRDFYIPRIYQAVLNIPRKLPGTVDSRITHRMDYYEGYDEDIID